MLAALCLAAFLLLGIYWTIEASVGRAQERSLERDWVNHPALSASGEGDPGYRRGDSDR